LDETPANPNQGAGSCSSKWKLHPCITRFHPSTKATATKPTMTRKTNLRVLLGWKLPQIRTLSCPVHPNGTSSI
jgi:hypothetical protein